MRNQIKENQKRQTSFSLYKATKIGSNWLFPWLLGPFPLLIGQESKSTILKSKDCPLWRQDARFLSKMTSEKLFLSLNDHKYIVIHSIHSQPS